MTTRYKILDDGTLVTCTGSRHHLHSLEHRPDTEYSCWPPSHREPGWADTLEEAEQQAGQPRTPCTCQQDTP